MCKSYNALHLYTSRALNAQGSSESRGMPAFPPKISCSKIYLPSKAGNECKKVEIHKTVSWSAHGFLCRSRCLVPTQARTKRSRKANQWMSKDMVEEGRRSRWPSVAEEVSDSVWWRGCCRNSMAMRMNDREYIVHAFLATAIHSSSRMTRTAEPGVRVAMEGIAMDGKQKRCSETK